MHNLEHKLEAILLYKNEPTSYGDLAALLKVPENEIRSAVLKLQKEYQDKGIVLVSTDDEVAWGTHPELSGLIEEMQREELAREIGRAGLETLAIVLYKGPVSRREIDYIRGVNSGFILRNLLVRGLVERTELKGERSYAYKPTLELLRHLGVGKREDLPDFASAFDSLDRFAATEKNDEEV